MKIYSADYESPNNLFKGTLHIEAKDHKESAQLEKMDNCETSNFSAYREIGTPEEEIQFWKVGFEKMTLERDEAQNLADKLARQGLNMMDANRSLTRERDEAREALAKEIKHHIETTEKWNGHHFDLTIALSDLNKTLRERDEARAFIEELVDLVAYGLGQHGSIWSQAAMTKAREAIAKSKSLEGAK